MEPFDGKLVERRKQKKTCMVTQIFVCKINQCLLGECRVAPPLLMHMITRSV